MPRFKAVAFLKSNNPFIDIFPDGNVPVNTLLPDKHSNYLAVDLDKITASQLLALSSSLTEDWKIKLQDINHTINYLQRFGCPIKISWFSGCLSSAPMPFLNIAPQKKGDRFLYNLDGTLEWLDWIDNFTFSEA